jgi:hypothetical protein
VTHDVLINLAVPTIVVHSDDVDEESLMDDSRQGTTIAYAH